MHASNGGLTVMDYLKVLRNHCPHSRDAVEQRGCAASDGSRSAGAAPLGVFVCAGGGIALLSSSPFVDSGLLFSSFATFSSPEAVGIGQRSC